jgi:carbon storage regulator CsrA
MLVTTRKVGQRIVIRENGETIGAISVCGIRKRTVSIGCEFPRHIEIVREELLPHPVAEAATEPPFGLGLPVEHWDSNRQA